MGNEYVCEKCCDTGKIRGSDGSIHVCFDCLIEGRLDVHSKSVKDSGVDI